MLFSIGNLITLGIVLIFFLVYHKLTANNRSLEKVKRLADKLEVQLNDYVGERAEELKHYGIDLDVQQKAAKIALEKLQTAQAAVAEKADAVGAIAERFKQYDEVLAKLMDMTARVDENLKRVHDEEVFAEGVNRKLDLAKKSLSAIEREMPLLREGFAQDAQKTIENFRDSILDELKSALTSVETELNTVRDEALAAFEKAQSARALVDEEFEKALATAQDRASSVEDQAFASLRASIEAKTRENSELAEAKGFALSQSIDSRIAELETEAESRLAKVGQETSSQVSALKILIGEFKEDWKREAEGMMSDISSKLAEAEELFAQKAKDVAGKLEQAQTTARKTQSDLEMRGTAFMARLEKETTEAQSRLAKESTAAVERLGANTAETLERLHGEQSETLETIARESSEARAVMASEALRAKEEAAKAKEASASLLSELKTRQEELRASLEATKNSIEEEFASFGQAFEDHRTRFEENFMAETKALGASLDTLSRRIEELKQNSYDTVKDKLKGFEDGMLADLSERRSKSFKQLDGWLSDMEKTLQTIATESAGRRRAEEEKYREEFRTRMVELRDELYSQMGKLKRNVLAVKEDIESEERDLAAQPPSKNGSGDKPA
ncbi:MAG: hypothetical protein RBT73_04135 [Spirochaetia bacterium]|jgi:hypothetical protein|nr:hypothetical protein [Spirochaetia bacterium]